VVAGRKIASEYLAIGTLAAVGGLVAISRSGSSKPKAKPIEPQLSTSGNKEEEDFIRNFIAEAEKEVAKK
ncbi:hypothetical protein CPB86DRAFT_690625, partial [Serendipita vermifera]